MHPYNPYEFFPPDFTTLAAKSDKLYHILYKSTNIDDGAKSESEDNEVEKQIDINFQDPDLSIALTEAILEQDFGVHVSLRQDRLCPPVPNRINYVAWLQEIIDETQTISQYFSQLEEVKIENQEERPTKRLKRHFDEQVRILDIGTGASCIYPILGCTLDDWEFVATDIDAESIEAARNIVDDPRNQGTSQATFTQGKKLDLHNRIHLSLRKSTDNVLPSEVDLSALNLKPIPWPYLEDGLLYHAVMCNPPFYKDKDEMQGCMEAKLQGPSAVCLGSESEMICKGGEAAFVIGIINESLLFKDRVLWFTSTLGKFFDVFPIVERLIQVNPESILVTEFIQGRTKRWAIAWSFLPYRIDTSFLHSNLLSIPALGTYSNTRYTRPMEINSLHPGSEKDRLRDLEEWINGYSLESKKLAENALIVMASNRSWSRAARRAKLRGERDESLLQGNKKCILCVRINLNGNILIPTWVYGQDKVIWDSFYSTVVQGWFKRIMALESTPVL